MTTRRAKVYLPRGVPPVVGGIVLLIWLFATSQMFFGTPADRLDTGEWLIVSAILCFPIAFAFLLSARRIAIYEIEFEWDDELDGPRG